MTTRRWDNEPKPHVERPPLLAPNSKSARRAQKPPNIKNRNEEPGKARIEPQHLARPARAAASATGANKRSGRCSACKARGVTLCRVAGSLVCASCRRANGIGYAPQSGHRLEPDHGNATRKWRTMTVSTAEKDIEGAARQGVRDRKAAAEYRKYKDFLKAYNLSKSPITLRMWNAYLPSRQPKPTSIARAKGRRDPSITAIPPQKPSSAAAARKNLEWAARQGREDRIAALLMKLNQQDTLVDMWR